MLKRVEASLQDQRGDSQNTLMQGAGEGIRIRDAAYPSPFPRTLEYNAPAHGTWNIVHIGMSVPQSHSIYVCSDNCLRGVVMTAAEMGCKDRFSSVTIRERDVQVDNLETITIEGVSDVIAHLPKQPPVVFVFLVCLHIFTGCDEDYVFRKLSERWPQIRFVKGYMDCIRQKEGPTPDMKLRMALYSLPESERRRKKRVNILGGDVPFRKDSELVQLLSSRGYDVRQIFDCENYEQFLGLGDAAVNVCTYPNGQDAVRAMSQRLESRFVYLSAAVSYTEIREQIRALSDVCGFAPVPKEWLAGQEAQCEDSLQKLSRALKDCSVVIDYTAHSRPLGIAVLLITHGIAVRCILLDQILEEEREAYEWLKENCPDLLLIPTVQPEMVRYGRGKPILEEDGRMVAFGQKAAWFCQTGHFVNMIEGGGLWGYQGIRELCTLLEEASLKESDYREIIPRKGMGWPSLCSVPPLTR